MTIGTNCKKLPLSRNQRNASSTFTSLPATSCLNLETLLPCRDAMPSPVLPRYAVEERLKRKGGSSDFGGGAKDRRRYTLFECVMRLNVYFAGSTPMSLRREIQRQSMWVLPEKWNRSVMNASPCSHTTKFRSGVAETYMMRVMADKTEMRTSLHSACCSKGSLSLRRCTTQMVLNAATAMTVRRFCSFHLAA